MNTAQPSAPKQIVIGGGFAGVYTACSLEELLRPEEANITLVNRENYWVYQPMLSEVISGSIGLANVVSPIRRLWPRTNLVTREIQDVDLANQTVTVSPGFRPRQLTLHYDYLVIALGNVTNFYGMPGLLEKGMPFKMLADAMILCNHVIRTLEERRRVFGRRGDRRAERFRAGREGELSAPTPRSAPLLVHSRNRILQEMAEPLSLFAEKTLRKRGVEIILEDRLVGAMPEKAILKSGLEIPARLSYVPYPRRCRW